MPAHSIFWITPHTPEWRTWQEGVRLPAGVHVLGDLDDPAAVAAVAGLQPDLILVAAWLDGVASFGLVEELRRRAPASRIAVLTEEPDEAELLAYARLGVAAYLERERLEATSLRQCLALPADGGMLLASRAAIGRRVGEPPLRVLLGERGDVVHYGLHELLATDPRFEVLEARGNPLRAAGRLQPDLIVYDPRHDGACDNELIAALHELSPTSRLVIFSAAFEPHAFLRLMQERVHGYLIQQPGVSGESVVEALELVGRHGCVVVDGVVAEHFWGTLHGLIALHAPSPAAPSLTQREHEVAELLVQGLSRAEIGLQLRISVRTVEFHLMNLEQKLAVQARGELIAALLEQGLASLPPRTRPGHRPA